MIGIKLIKFDLPINGIKARTLDELRDNLSDELLALARSGQLGRWLASRKHEKIAQAVAAAVVAESDDKALFLALCRALEVKVHPDDVAALFDEPPQAGRRFVNGSEEKNSPISFVAIREVLEDFLLLYMRNYRNLDSGISFLYKGRGEFTKLMLDKFSKLEFFLDGKERNYFIDNKYFNMYAKPEAVVKVGDVLKKGVPIAFSKNEIFLSNVSGRVRWILCSDSSVDVLIERDTIEI